MTKNLIVAPVTVNLMKNLPAGTVQIDYAKGTVTPLPWNLDAPNACEKAPEIVGYEWPVNGLWSKHKRNIVRYWLWNGAVVKAQSQKAFGWIDFDSFPAFHTEARRKGLGVNHQEHKLSALRLWEIYRNRYHVTIPQRKGKPLSLFGGYWDSLYNGKFFGARKFSSSNPLTA